MFDLCELLEPTTLQEAVQCYGARPDLKVIAGGTDVLIRMRHGDLPGANLLSLRAIPGLDAITLREDGTLAIGAMAPFTRITQDPLVRELVPILAEAAGSVGGPQVRNVATLGGNLCNGAVSADSASTLFALDAVLQLESRAGTRLLPIAEFYAGPGRVHLGSGELLTAILIPEAGYRGMGGCYIKYAMRKAMDIATLGVAAVCRVRDGRFETLRLALGTAGPVPFRCAEAEAFAQGRPATADTIQELGRLAVKPAAPRTSWRASREYREHLIDVLTQRAVAQAAQRGGGCCAQ